MDVVLHDALTLSTRSRRVTDPLILQRIFSIYENLPFSLCTYVRESCSGIQQMPFRHIALFVQSRCVQIEHTYRLHVFVLIRAVEVAVPTLGTAKILYKRKLGLFAMYVCTSSVRTHIAKTLKRTIYANPLRY